MHLQHLGNMSYLTIGSTSKKEKVILICELSSVGVKMRKSSLLISPVQAFENQLLESATCILQPIQETSRVSGISGGKIRSLVTTVGKLVQILKVKLLQQARNKNQQMVPQKM